MARRKKRRKAPRKNPSPRRRAIVRRARSSIAGLNFRTALKNVPLAVVGMFLTKWAAKRGGGALEDDRASWSGMTYLKGGLGCAAGGWIGNMIRPGSGQKILEGGLTLLLYKAVQNHLIPKSSWAMNQLGAGEGYQPGDVEVNEAGEPFILGAGGDWVPMDEGDAAEGMPELMGVSPLEDPGRLGMYGDYIEPAGRLGLGQGTADAYAESLFQR